MEWLAENWFWVLIGVVLLSYTYLVMVGTEDMENRMITGTKMDSEKTKVLIPGMGNINSYNYN